MNAAMSALDGIDISGLMVCCATDDGVDSVVLIGGGRDLIIQHQIPKRQGKQPWLILAGKDDSQRCSHSWKHYTHAEVQASIRPLIEAMKEAAK